MPDLEERLRNGLDRLGAPPDPDRILERVGHRKRRLRTVRRVQTVALVFVVLAAVAGSMYGLSRAFGFGHHAVPIGNPPSAVTTPPTVARCSAGDVHVALVSQQGAAGTISTLWRATNTSSQPCRSLGYPGMDFQAAGGWLGVQVHRGGFPNINAAPAKVTLEPGASLYFVSYWNDATTSAGACRQFDRVKITLPDERVPTELPASGCLNPDAVDVGPVSARPPT